ncbi:hypothetical protein Acr_00g0022460 [Actinidia rufa]|uniref:Uncharacterized protein n=1 Tax=Actinidia rufa TaxID=165716 RepID=A0A7J0DCL1_9ERIC|nr:hypothetical protein Acr_00g0022460 [Actinidia rufa]
MNRCAYQQIAMEAASDSVFCPKPRRIGLLNPSNDQIRQSLWQINSHRAEIYESKAGSELLDIILSKGGYGAEKSNTQVASSPPYFCGSPPSRASNPLIQDSQFRNEKFNPSLQAPIPATSPRTGGSCARMKFGQKPATVRIEGFDCLNRDRRSVSAVA